MLSRRQFVKTSLAGSTLIAAGSTVPQFLASTAFAADEVKNTDRILVVVQLTGGNDGLNTVIPYGDDLYHKARPTLGFKKN
ncbi:MAG: twin-arginine translocation signal domain-containing protein, partial [Planctomycetes bacterium]|nr:twin-arginine translocation signal domain-containing protein [Planctomycetota bacterium]